MSLSYDYDMMFSGLSEVLIGLLLSNSVTFLFTLAAYILTALSLYTIAQRRGIKHPWLAWIPIADLWILGSISDQYQYVTQGLIRNRRKTLVILKVLAAILCVATVACGIWFTVNAVEQGPILESILENGMDPIAMDRFLEAVVPPILAVSGAALVMSVLVLTETVFRYICYYNLFASCQPDNKVLYIILSIFITITLPIFLMICRNKDLGMPPRKTQQTPVQTIPENLE